MDTILFIHHGENLGVNLQCSDIHNKERQAVCAYSTMSFPMSHAMCVSTQHIGSVKLPASLFLSIHRLQKMQIYPMVELKHVLKMKIKQYNFISFSNFAIIPEKTDSDMVSCGLQNQVTNTSPTWFIPTYNVPV